jgi:hypothetical protein
MHYLVYIRYLWVELVNYIQCYIIQWVEQFSTFKACTRVTSEPHD